MKLLDKIAFVDVETTGFNSRRDRVIEIAVIRMENGKVVKTFNSLVDPGDYLPPEITTLTGIYAHDLESAPSFRKISDEIFELLADCVFIAHNARFDYGFLKAEFKRVGLALKVKQLCTVKLSRQLFPNEISHNLDAIISRFNIEVTDRHRAMADAEVIKQFYKMVTESFEEEKLTKVIAHLMGHPSVPKSMDHLQLKNLPEKPGVYIFYGDSGMPLYVGKSTNIKTRIYSHFSATTVDAHELQLATEVVQIETEVCGGELSALLRESELIKKLKPLHNRWLRQAEELLIINTGLSKSGYKITVVEKGANPGPDTVGMVKTTKQATDFLRLKCTDNQLCEKLLGLEKIRSRCFKSDLGGCLACTGQEDPNKYNLRFDLAFAGNKFPTWPFSGPILIREGNKAFGFNEWCYFGQSKNETWIEENQPFNLDTFNILKRYLQNPKNRKNIKNLTN